MTNTKVERPNYYAILPSEIRYDKALSHLEKLIYAEIGSLSNKEGYCYASNKYFSDHFGNTERTVSRAINKLSNKGYIFTLIEGHNRRIYLNTHSIDLSNLKTKMSTAIDKNVYGGRQKCLHNNISNNINNIEDNKSSPPVKNTDHCLPRKYGGTSISRMVEVYNLMWKRHFGFPSFETAMGKNAKIMSNLLKRFNEYEVASMILIHFEWKGVGGENEYIHKRMAESGFPISWLPSNINAYQVFIKNVLGIKDVEKLKERVDKVLEECYGKK